MANEIDTNRRLAAVAAAVLASALKHPAEADIDLYEALEADLGDVTGIVDALSHLRQEVDAALKYAEKIERTAFSLDRSEDAIRIAGER